MEDLQPPSILLPEEPSPTRNRGKDSDQDDGESVAMLSPGSPYSYLTETDHDEPSSNDHILRVNQTASKTAGVVVPQVVLTPFKSEKASKRAKQFANTGKLKECLLALVQLSEECTLNNNNSIYNQHHQSKTCFFDHNFCDIFLKAGMLRSGRCLCRLMPVSLLP